MGTNEKLSIIAKKTFIDNNGVVHVVDSQTLRKAAQLDQPHLSPDGLLIVALNAEEAAPVRV